MKKITAYLCSHGCGFYRMTKKSVEAHEQRCFSNHATKSCGSCIYLIRDNSPYCIAGIRFENGKLRTQCESHVDYFEDMDEALQLLEQKGVIKIIRP